jgi:hypothetical protein
MSTHTQMLCVSLLAFVALSAPVSGQPPATTAHSTDRQEAGPPQWIEIDILLTLSVMPNECTEKGYQLAERCKKILATFGLQDLETTERVGQVGEGPATITKAMRCASKTSGTRLFLLRRATASFNCGPGEVSVDIGTEWYSPIIIISEAGGRDLRPVHYRNGTIALKNGDIHVKEDTEAKVTVDLEKKIDKIFRFSKGEWLEVSK